MVSEQGTGHKTVCGVVVTLILNMLQPRRSGVEIQRGPHLEQNAPAGARELLHAKLVEAMEYPVGDLQLMFPRSYQEHLLVRAHSFFFFFLLTVLYHVRAVVRSHRQGSHQVGSAFAIQVTHPKLPPGELNRIRHIGPDIKRPVPPAHANNQLISALVSYDKVQDAVAVDVVHRQRNRPRTGPHGDSLSRSERPVAVAEPHIHCAVSHVGNRQVHLAVEVEVSGYDPHSALVVAGDVHRLAGLLGAEPRRSPLPVGRSLKPLQEDEVVGAHDNQIGDAVVGEISGHSGSGGSGS